MPSWNELLNEFNATDPADRGTWLNTQMVSSLGAIRAKRGNRNVLFYGSAFLQKPQAPAPLISIQPEDLNGFMSVMHGMNWSSGLTLLLHTPGGSPTAAETIVEYLRSKFTDMEVIVPTYAMSAGTMISLAADRLVMGRQSQLGPIDPQFIGGSRPVSARGIVDQFKIAKDEILANQKAAHAWHPILQSMGPALLQDAQNALDYGEAMVARWLANHMLKANATATADGKRIASHFNDASTHKSHGRRIGRDEARQVGLIVEDLEADQDLQEAVLTAYHLLTLVIEQGPAAKVITSDAGRIFVKNWTQPQQGVVQFLQPPVLQPSSPP
ncbi:MAG: hypothetical protein JWN04_978 [Myxococcaceae bacterium]|nr:hypothetical protein [Myxococcaceae bacterium]